MAEKAPIEVVVIVAGKVACSTPSNRKVIVTDGSKLAPRTITNVPAGPEIGVRVMLGVTTEKSAAAVPDDASVALTV